MGMIVNPIVLEKGLKASFLKAFNEMESSDHMDLMSLIPSTANNEKYGWLGAVPAMKLWKDEKQVKALESFSYTLVNQDYEATLGVDRNALEDDQLGAIKMQIAELARQAKLFPRKLLTDALAAGDTDLCYDGLPFFSASHVEGNSGTQSNLLSGNAGTGYTVSNFKKDFIAARAAIFSFKNSAGEPMSEGVNKFKIVIAPSLQGVAEEALNSSLIDNTTNSIKGSADIMISSRLSGNDWYLVELSGVLKPFILQERKPVNFVSLQEGSESAFKRKMYEYSVEWRGKLGYGLWQKACKVNN